MENAKWLFLALFVASCATTSPQKATPDVAAPKVVKSDFKKEVQPPAEPEPFPHCYTGVFIVGEGDKAGQVEMQGCPAELVVYSPMLPGNADPAGSGYLVGKSIIKNPDGATPSALLKVDISGQYHLPNDHLKKGVSAFLVFEENDPIIHFVSRGKKSTIPLHPVYMLSSYVTQDRKLTPFITQGILPLDQRVESMQGDLVGRGKAFHMSDRKKQLMTQIFIPGCESDTSCERR